VEASISSINTQTTPPLDVVSDQIVECAAHDECFADLMDTYHGRDEYKWILQIHDKTFK